MTRTRQSELPLSKLAQSRSRIYQILATVYAQPADEPLLELLHSWGMFQGQLTPPSLPKIMKRGLNKLESWFKKYGFPSSPESLTILGAEFTRLFRGLLVPSLHPHLMNLYI